MKVITIGRLSENDIVVDDAHASRHHMQIIQHDDGHYTLSDFGSTNGTYVNGQRISGEIVLNPNDIVRIGNTTLPWRMYFENSEPSWQTPSQQPSTQIAPQSSQPQYLPEENKARNWFVTLYLILMLVSSVIMAGYYLIKTVEAADYLSSGNIFMYLLYTVGSIIMLVGSIMLLTWKKIGYWLCFASSAISLVMSIWMAVLAGSLPYYLSGPVMTAAIVGMIGAVAGPIALWAILQISKNGFRCWNLLK